MNIKLLSNKRHVIDEKQEMKFTVIIPTRDRLDTLRWSLQTCLIQNYKNLVILVSDNASSDGTEDFIKTIADPRVKYVNPRKRLGMSQHWEFALSHVTDGFVFFMGDDDGLLPNAIEKAHHILSQTKSSALTWNKASYAWPNHIVLQSRNRLRISLKRNLSIRNTGEILNRISQFDPDLGHLAYEQLPSLYNSFVAIEAINNARGHTGAFFYSLCPDIYSAIALTNSLKKYVYFEAPLSINGASAHSTGTSTTNEECKQDAAEKFYQEENIALHKDVHLAPSIPLMIAESMWQVRDNVPGCENYDVDIKKLCIELNKLLKELSEKKKLEVKKAIEKICQVRGIENKFDCVGQESPRSFIKRVRSLYNYIPTFERQFEENEVSNIFQASLILEDLMSHKFTNFFIFKVRLKNWLMIGLAKWNA